jgi:hypothetical protein
MSVPSEDGPLGPKHVVVNEIVINKKISVAIDGTFIETVVS